MATVAVYTYRKESCTLPSPASVSERPLLAPDDDHRADHSGADLENTLQQEEGKQEGLLLPQPFLEFLVRSGVDPSIYSAVKTLPRYIRIKPGFEQEIVTFEAELGCELVPLAWLQGFYSLPQEAQIAGCEAYKCGKIYGMDAASGAAVVALGVVPGDHVLDLCAAPGAKFCMIADHLGNSGTLTGVDVAHDRLAACRSMLQKYGLGERCRLFVADGTCFQLLPCQQSTHEDGARVLDADSVFGEWTSRRRHKERKRDARRAQLKLTKRTSWVVDKPEMIFYGKESGVVGLVKESLFENSCKDGEMALECGYDKVLVDVECTHDGSLRHIFKYEQWGWDTIERRVLDQNRLASITGLQLQLLSNGFRLMKAGGTLVYSTCSFTLAQNEEVIGRFLADQPNAELVEIEEMKRQVWPCTNGQLNRTLRFDPITSKTNGLFIAKMCKRAPEPPV